MGAVRIFFHHDVNGLPSWELTGDGRLKLGREDQGSELSALPHPAPHQLCAGHSPATHICLVPQPWDAEGLQKVTAAQQQDPQL